MDYQEQFEAKLMEVFEENGVLIDDKDELLSEYIPDSITFVSIIIGIEEKFDVELPDEMLVFENLGTFNTLKDRLETEIIFYRALNDSDIEPANNGIQKREEVKESEEST